MALLLLFIWLKFSVTFNDSLEKNLILYSLLPLFLDWSLTTFHLIKSNNVIRFFSGIIASFGLSRWWALWLTQSHLDVFYSVARIYSITIALVFLVMIYRYRPLKNEKGMSV